MPHDPGRVDQIDEIGQKAQQGEGGPEALQGLDPAAQKDHDAHGGAGMEGQLLNIDLPIGQGHQEKVQNIKPKGQVRQPLRHPFGTLDRQSKNHRRQSDPEKMPRPEAAENRAAGPVGQKIM